MRVRKKKHTNLQMSERGGKVPTETEEEQRQLPGEGQPHEDNEGLQPHDCACCSGGREHFKELVNSHIQENGYTMVPVTSHEDDFVFAYTIGLTETWHVPELVICGKFAPMQVCGILQTAAEMVRDQKTRRIFCGDSYSVAGVIQVKVHGEIQDGNIGCRPVTRANKLEMLCQAANRYGDDGFHAVQLILPDLHGLLPWDTGYDSQGWDITSGQRKLYALDENDK